MDMNTEISATVLEMNPHFPQGFVARRCDRMLDAVAALTKPLSEADCDRRPREEGLTRSFRRTSRSLREYNAADAFH